MIFPPRLTAVMCNPVLFTGGLGEDAADSKLHTFLLVLLGL